MKYHLEFNLGNPELLNGSKAPWCVAIYILCRLDVKLYSKLFHF